jgi:hypothetical protein
MKILISTKSWHYQFINLCLGNLTPKPKNMASYFLQLIFCGLIFWFVIPIRYYIYS